MSSLQPISTNVKLLWERISFSRLTIAYFTFSCVHFIIQVSLQLRAFSINAAGANTLSNLLMQTNQTQNGFVVYNNDNLRQCTTVPSTINTNTCSVVWNGTASTDNWVDAPTNLMASTYTAASTSTYIPYSTLSSPSLTLTSGAPSSSTAASSSVATTKPPGVTVVTVVEVVHASKTQAVATPSSAVTESLIETDNSKDNGSDDEGAYENVNLVYKPHNRRSEYDQFTVVANNNGTFSVTLNGFGYHQTSAVLNPTCLKVLSWPVEVLKNTKREDLTFIFFQVWVLGMSLVALLNESIPHVIASLLTHTLATAWAAFQINHTATFRAQFLELTVHGACAPANLLPNYWDDRARAEIASLALNGFALFVSSFLTWRLIKLFGWQTFKRVGASLTINRVYKTVLTFSITLQMAFFFIASTLGLWLDQLFNGSIGRLASFGSAYKTTFTMSLLLLIPWLALGWSGVRRELSVRMAIFLVISALYVVATAIMFISPTFRWTFVEWRFFSLIASASVFLTLLSFVLGVVCRHNFGKGLSRYLNAQEPLSDGDFESEYAEKELDLEKVDFPSRGQPLPSYSLAYGPEPQVPAPVQISEAPRMGPRFFNQSAEPFEPQPTAAAPRGSPSHSRSSSNVSNGESDGGLSRQNSQQSQRSFSSLNSAGSGSNAGARSAQKKRWVIE